MAEDYSRTCLDAARLATLLQHDCRLVVLETTTSTNDEVFRRVDQGEGCYEVRPSDNPENTDSPDRWLRPLVVVSAEQTAGRGRLGRAWASPPGGLYLSALVDAGTDGERVASLSPLTALAIRAALKGFTTDELRIKWPNDLILTRGKLAGILVESRRGQRTPSASSSAVFSAVVGVGINVNRPDEGAFAGAGYLNDAMNVAGAVGATGATVRQLPLEEVAAAVIDSLVDYQGRWLAAGGSFAPFASEYQEHMVLRGEQVCVRDAAGAEIARGIVESVDDEARLLLAQERGVVAVAAGEVTLRDNA
jgi:BirA family biotin operon repressor/biotin-[acetyl-CoA-carboxylase] ligase